MNRPNADRPDARRYRGGPPSPVPSSKMWTSNRPADVAAPRYMPRVLNGSTTVPSRATAISPPSPGRRVWRTIASVASRTDWPR